MNKGFHITLKSKLPSIFKKGLTPMIGRRSDSVGENTPIVSFTNDVRTIQEWKIRLYPNISFDDLIVFTFNIDEIKYAKRYDNYGDFFTIDTISKDELKIIELIDKFGNKVSLDKLNEFFLNNETGYEIVERAIEYKKNIVTEQEQRQILESLASYEHKKWSQYQDAILWTSKSLADGSKVISKEKINDILKYLDAEYNQTDEIYKSEVRKRIKETYFIIAESPLFDELNISEKELINVLEIFEHNRSCRWNKYMLSQCFNKSGEYIIPKEKAKSWIAKIQQSYINLSEEQKKSDMKEAKNIFCAINEYKSKIIESTNELNNSDFFSLL